MTYLVMALLIPVAFVAISIVIRAIELRASARWMTISATIVSVNSVMICDIAVVFIDVVYEFSGIQCKRSNLNTRSCSPKAFRIGNEISIVVDPENPEICKIERRTIWDGPLLRIFRSR